jgi:hypothetical protein
MPKPFGFIPSGSFADLPSEPDKRFLILSEIAEDNFNRMALGVQNAMQLDDLRHRFMIQIDAMAKKLNLPGSPSITEGPPSNGEWNKFLGLLEGLKTALHLGPNVQAVDYEIEISGASRRKILLEINKLKSIVTHSDLPSGERDRILAKLDSLISSIQNRRMSFKEFLTVTATIAGLCGGTASALANAPEAKETIVNILSHLDGEIDSEDDPLMLPPPVKALPSPGGVVRKNEDSENADGESGEE